MTAQPLFDGTFSSDAVASAAHALVAQLHDEAMATIARLADGWGQPVDDVPPAEDSSVVYREPATWSAVDDQDEAAAPTEDDEQDEDDVQVVPRVELPAVLPRPRTAGTNVTARVEQPLVENVAGALAAAVTDEFAVPMEDDRQSIAV